MILIGTMNITRTRSEGQFHCPECRANCDYRLRAATPFLTLYFVPVIPIGGAEEFVQCSRCKNRFEKPVLANLPNDVAVAITDQFGDEVLRCMVLVIAEDGHILPREIDAIQDLSQRLLERKVTRDEVLRLVSLTGQTKVKTYNFVRSMAKRWNLEQRKRALQAMFLAASADGGLRDERAAVLKQLMTALNMDETEFRQVISEAVNQA
jgi:uncharacterized tellurite resistance protein B-like protein